jgi:hypothetical protein
MTTTIRFLSESTDLFIEFTPSSVVVYPSQLDDGFTLNIWSFEALVRGLEEIVELGCVPTGGHTIGKFEMDCSPDFVDSPDVIQVTRHGEILGNFDIQDLAEIKAALALVQRSGR